MGCKLIEGILVDSETGEIINEVEDVEVVVEENKLPEIFLKGGTRIQSNIKQLKTSLIEHLESFNIEVTQDTEKEASKQATQLNKIAKELNSARLEVSKEIKKPAEDLKKAVDELIDLVQEKRTAIIEKVDVFKSARFDIIKDLVEFEMLRLYTAHEVEEEFRTVNVDSLIQEGSYNGKGLTKKALETLSNMVFKAKATQSAVKIRLLELPLKCQDLEVHIEKQDIEHILLLDEAEYTEKLDALIANRLDIETKMKAREVAKKEEELKQQQEKEVQKVKEVKKIEKETGKKMVRMVATFEVEVNTDKDENDILIALKRKLVNEYKSLVDISLI